MRNAIGMLKLISQGESDIRCGRTKPQENMFNEIESRSSGLAAPTADFFIEIITEGS